MCEYTFPLQSATVVSHCVHDIEVIDTNWPGQP
jgi:hypothetical protein